MVKNILTENEISRMVQFNKDFQTQSYIVLADGPDTDLLRELYKKGMLTDLIFRGRSGNNAETITLKKRNFTEAGLRVIEENKNRF